METLIEDAYGYLEDGTDPRTRAWTEAQNARSRAYLESLPGRATLVPRLDALLAIGSTGVPVERGGRYFFMARSGDDDQAVLRVREAGVERTLLDPVDVDPTGLTALDWWYPSPNGTFVAYGLSRNGDERSTLYLLDVARARSFGETIPYTRYSSLAWLPDERGFYYTRYPAGENYGPKVYLHALGAAWEDDPLIFGEGRSSEEFTAIALSPDGRYLVVEAHRGWSANDVYVADLRASEPFGFVAMAESRQALFDVRFRGGELLVRTNEGAPRYKVLGVPAHAPSLENAREIVPEDATATLEDFAVARGGIVLSYLRDASSRLEVLFESGRRSVVDLGLGATPYSVMGVSARQASREVFVLTDSFMRPPRVTRLRFDGDALADEVFGEVASPIDASRYSVEQRWFPSKDGTRVPMFVVSRNGLAFDGTAPALLYGYGGFNVNMTPSFMPSLTPWLDAGGVYALANLRGGGEFGEEWHRAGMLGKKQNVFDDFIAAAEYLSAAKIADRRRIAIQGGSNGGLLVAAVEVQRPELFAAVICAVPLTDMLRYPEFLIARLWVPEYGDPADPAAAAWLRAYSPYHNVREGVRYPPTYVVTAESDTRVDPAHARKFAARLAAANAGDAPILLYVEPNAGHGIGKPRAKQVEELADRWAFLGAALDVAV
jgi:prolyl oligopeptidase